VNEAQFLWGEETVLLRLVGTNRKSRTTILSIEEFLMRGYAWNTLKYSMGYVYEENNW